MEKETFIVVINHKSMKSTQNNWEEKFHKEFPYRTRDIQEFREKARMKSFIRSVEEKARESGYIFALEVLRKHISEQVYESTVRTESIIEYIDKAIAHHQSLK